jgi:hypothetical protein
LDSRNNIYAGSYFGFTKYRSDGSFVYTKSVPYYTSGPLLGDFSLDKLDNAHVVFFANSSTLVNNNQSFPVNLSTKVVYDSTGQVISVKQLSSNPRWSPVGYKAVDSSNYYMTAWWPGLSCSSYTLEYGYNIAGGGTVFNCHYKFPVNPVNNEVGMEFYSGQVGRGPCVTCTASPVLTISPSSEITSLTGADIFYVTRSAGLDDWGNSTSQNGFTDEIPSRMAIDAAGHSIYIVGSWSKIADTSKFRFGNVTLVNPGAVGSKDVLLLKLNYSPLPVSVTAGNDVAICFGGSTQLNGRAAGGDGSYSYSWSPATGLNNTSIANPVAKPSVTTNYILTVTDGSGNTAKDSVTVFVNKDLFKPVITEASGLTLCEGFLVTLSASGGTSYLWNTGDQTRNIAVTKSGVYTVTVQNAQGCINTSDPFTLLLNPRPTGTITSATTNICPGDSVLLTLNTAADNSILWSNGATSQNIWVKSAGSYEAVLISPKGCRNNTNAVLLSAAPLPTPTITQEKNLLSVFPEAATYQWFLSGTAIPGATARTLTIEKGGNYSVAVTNGSGCKATTSKDAVLRRVDLAFPVNVYPNPSEGDINIVYDLPVQDRVTIAINDFIGRRILLLADRETQSAGAHQYLLKKSALPVSTGYYIIKIQAGDKQVIQKLVIL